MPFSVCKIIKSCQILNKGSNAQQLLLVKHLTEINIIILENIETLVTCPKKHYITVTSADD